MQSHERFRVVDLIVRTLAQSAANGSGFVVIVDDVHWADPASLLLLRHLVARAAEMYLLLVVNFRAPAVLLAGRDGADRGRI